MTNTGEVSATGETWLTHKYDVFISYKHTAADIELRNKFFHAIERLGLIPFADELSLPAGIPWESAIESVLEPPSDAMLLVLGTDSVLRDPNWVKREVDFAKSRGSVILVVQYAQGVSQKLELEATQYRAARISDQDPLVDELVELLRYDLHERLRRRYLRPRQEAEQWVADVLKPLKPDFWGSEWRRYFSPTSSLALLADGGSGKTVCLAHYLHQVFDEDENSKCHLMLISASVLRNGPEEVAQLIGAHPGKEAEHASRLKKDWEESFLFVVDALDRVRVESEDVRQRIKRTLQILSECGRVVVTCRRQVWENDYQSLPLERSVLRPLPPAVIQEVLPGTILQPGQQTILEIPLFLDYAIRAAERDEALPENVSEFLRDIYDEPMISASGGGVPANEGKQVAAFMHALASEQLEKMTFEVSREEVAARTKLPADEIDKVLTNLRNTGILHETSGRIRLRHDLIDGHGVVRLLLEAETGKNARESLWKRLNGDCGWSVASSLLLVAYEKPLKEVTRETFEEFTRILDHKRFNADLMAKSWAVTYALRERIYEIWPTIKEYLDGDLAESLDPRSPEHLGKTVSCPGYVTQETASTLASAFMALSRERRVADPEVLRVLIKWLNRPGYRYTFRFIQALANLGTAEARRAVFEFARRELVEFKDPELLGVLAGALGQLRGREAADLLKKIYELPWAPARARRLALESLRAIDPLGGWPLPQVTDDEMVEGLAIRNPWDGYSDWQTVSEYADLVKTGLRKGDHPSPRVLSALLGAMKHDHTFVKKPVAECLGWLDEPAARDALLSVLLISSLPSEVRVACIQSLRMQLLRLQSAQQRCTFRLTALMAGCAARQSQALSAERDLLALATNDELFHRDDWLVTPLAVQALPAIEPESFWEVHAELVQPQDYPLPISAEKFLTAQELAQIGSPFETKYRVAGAIVDKTGRVTLRLAPADWVSSRSFHALASSNLPQVIETLHHWPEPVPVGADWLHGILAVQCIVVTSDDHLLLVRRSHEVSYYPAHWSLSFEEQVSEEDFQKEEDFASAAARRGFAEEFGKELEIRRLVTLSGLIEVETLNFSLVVLLEMNETAASIVKRWQTEPRPAHHHEAMELRAEPISEFATGNKALSGLSVHPTSELRADLWRRWRQGNKGV